jgi:hypothetical protein
MRVVVFFLGAKVKKWSAFTRVWTGDFQFESPMLSAELKRHVPLAEQLGTWLNLITQTCSWNWRCGNILYSMWVEIADCMPVGNAIRQTNECNFFKRRLNMSKLNLLRTFRTHSVSILACMWSLAIIPGVIWPCWCTCRSLLLYYLAKGNPIEGYPQAMMSCTP